MLKKNKNLNHWYMTFNLNHTMYILSINVALFDTIK